MGSRRRLLFVTFISTLAGAALLAAGCADGAAVEPEPPPRSSAAQLPLVSAGLVPPAPFVLGADGVTKLSLEDAKILRSGGRRWARVLGKALFWDQQAGSDGNACASCHFHAGADSRLTNQISPGLNDITKGPDGDTRFGSERSDTGTVLPGHMPSGAVAGSNYTLKPADLPMHRLTDESDRNAPIITTTNDRLSSQGAFAADFRRVRSGGEEDKCGPADATVFHAGRLAARQVEARQTPSFHNAAFNFRNFWDNRANNLFNGVGPFGMRDVDGDPDNRLVVLERGMPRLTSLRVENASLASQALAPPTSQLEMSCKGRTFADVGRKLLATRPLAWQRVSREDSVLGPYVGPHGRGLARPYDYEDLIKRAFSPKYWELPGRYRISCGKLVEDPRGHTQMELNFSMFWGLAIAEYESLTISDRSEFDDLQATGRLVMTPSFVPVGPAIGGCSSPTGDVDPLLVRGCTIFARLNAGPAVPTPPDGIRGGNCFVCHNAQGGGVGRPSQPLLAEGAIQEGEDFQPFLTVADVNGFNDLRDQGSANVGLRPVFSDQMSGRSDPYGNPLSFGRQLWNYLDGQPGAVLDPPLQRAIDSGNIPARVGLDQPTPPNTFRKLEADGSSKAPILRNVALTPPYFSWGGYPTLRQVLKVFNRGFNRRDITGPNSLDAHGSACVTGDDSGSGPDGNQPWPVEGADCNTNTTGLILPLGLSDCDANGAPNEACTAKGHTVEDDDLAALVRFMKALTDRRVQCDQAPFDHPELVIFDGHRRTMWDRNHDGKAEDVTFRLPAVGASGYSRWSGLCIPNAGDLFAPGMQARSGGRRVPLRE
jgi:cytochrome c peroxidase